MSETYEMNIDTFENGKPEELFALTKNFKNGIDGTGIHPLPGVITIYAPCHVENIYKNLTSWRVKSVTQKTPI